MSFSDAQMNGRKEGWTDGCTCAHCQEKTWTCAAESAPCLSCVELHVNVDA